MSMLSTGPIARYAREVLLEESFKPLSIVELDSTNQSNRWSDGEPPMTPSKVVITRWLSRIVSFLSPTILSSPSDFVASMVSKTIYSSSGVSRTCCAAVGMTVVVSLQGNQC